jgi:hypothetical protein
MSPLCSQLQLQRMVKYELGDRRMKRSMLSRRQAIDKPGELFDRHNMSKMRQPRAIANKPPTFQMHESECDLFGRLLAYYALRCRVALASGEFTEKGSDHFNRSNPDFMRRVRLSVACHYFIL